MAARRKPARPLADATLFMIEIRARDWQGLCAFYGEVLGLPAAMRDEASAFAMFGREPPYLAVVKKQGTASAGRSRVLPDFAVPDLDGVLESLKARGVKVLSPPAHSPEGYRIARICDPEGNELHVFEWVKPSPARA